jgi:hypothetical protein
MMLPYLLIHYWLLVFVRAMQGIRNTLLLLNNAQVLQSSLRYTLTHLQHLLLKRIRTLIMTILWLRLVGFVNLRYFRLDLFVFVIIVVVHRELVTLHLLFDELCRMVLIFREMLLLVIIVVLFVYLW